MREPVMLSVICQIRTKQLIPRPLLALRALMQNFSHRKQICLHFDYFNQSFPE